MTIALVNATPFVNAIGAVTPTPPTFAIGQQVIVWTGEFLGADTISAPGAPWVELDANNQAPQTRCFGMTSVTGAEAMPSFNWSATNRGWAKAASFSGLDSLFSAAFAAVDRVSTQAQNIVGPGVTRTPSANNSVVFFYGQRNKTTTSNATVYSPPTNFTLLDSLVLTGTSPSVCIGYWIQTAATIIPANEVFSGTVADGSAQSLQSSLFAILQGTGTPSVGQSMGLLGVGS